MNKYMKNSLIATFIFPVVSVLFFLAFANAVASQNPINVNLSVRQPVSPFLNDFAAQFQGDPADGSIPQNINAMLVNNTSNTYRVKLSMRIERLSPAPLSISTKPDYQPAAPIILGPRQSLNLDQNLKNTAFSNLNIRDMIFENTSLEELRENGLNVKLPEGLYRVCVDAYDYDSQGQSRLLSSRGMTCATFYICYTASPPSFFLPFTSSDYGRRGSVLDTLKPNAGMIQFGWNRSTTTCGYPVGQLEYEFEVKSIYPGQTINDSKFNTPVFKKNLRTLTFNFSTSMYPDVFQDGKSYVATVKAIPVMRGSDSPVEFANRGESEPISFIYKDKKLLSGGPIKDPIFTLNPGEINLIGMSSITGRLGYKFKEVDYKTRAYYIPREGDDPIVYNIDYLSGENTVALKNKKLSLVVAYVYACKTPMGFVTIEACDGKVYGDEYGNDSDYKIVATTTTDAEGNFSFTFANLENNLGVEKEATIIGSGGKSSGFLYKVFRIRVEDNYYLSPDVNILVKPYQNVDLGKLCSYVKSYNLTVHVKVNQTVLTQTSQSQDAVEGVQMAILRHPENNLSSVPQDEGATKMVPKPFPKNDANKGYGRTDKNGNFVFKNLVQHNPDNPSDRYFIRCVPSKAGGVFNFQDKEYSYYPAIPEYELYSFPFHKKQSQYYKSYYDNSKTTPVPGSSVRFYSDIKWNSEFQVENHQKTIEVMPEEPRIFGKVQNALSNDGPIADAIVATFQEFKEPRGIAHSILLTRTDEKGRYQYIYDFDEIEYDTKNFDFVNFFYPIIGPKRKLVASATGYKSESRPKAGLLAPMKWGDQLEWNFDLYPDAILSGIIRSEDGKNISAVVIIDNTISVHTHDFSGVINGKFVLQRYEAMVPSGKRSIRVIPDDDKQYAVLDTFINIKKDIANKADFTVKKMQKHIRFQILEKHRGIELKGATGKSVTPIAGIPVSINLPDGRITQSSDNDGWVSFIFTNGGKEFNFYIEPPEDMEYENATYTITGVKDGVEMETYKPVYLSKTISIEGLVTHRMTKVPLEGARVYVGEGNNEWENAYTDKNGKYRIAKVSLATPDIKLSAAKSGTTPNLITETKDVTLKSTGENEVNFLLLANPDFIIEDLFGFEVEIGSTAEEGPNSFRIDGEIVNFQGNENFDIRDGHKSLKFSNLRVIKTDRLIDEIPVAIPVNDFMDIDESYLPFTLQTHFLTIQEPLHGKKLLIEAEDGIGSIKGKMYLDKGSFIFNEDKLRFNDNDDQKAMLISMAPGSDVVSIPSISAGPVDKIKFGVYPLNEKDFAIEYNGFVMSIDRENSWIQDDGLNLRTVLEISDIPLMSPSVLNLDVGDFVIKPTEIMDIEFDENRQVEFKLEDWEFIGKGWSLVENSSKIKITSGMLIAGAVEVPTSAVTIAPGSFLIDELEINNFMIGGIIPLKIMDEKPIFGYCSSCTDDEKGHYELKIISKSNSNHAAEIRSLPGMKAKDAFKLQAVSLYSNGYQFFNQGPFDDWVKLYSVIKVKPTQFTVEEGKISINCGIDLELPGLETFSSKITYFMESGELKMNSPTFYIDVEGPGRVTFQTDNKGENLQTVSEGLFKAKGIIKEDFEGIRLLGTLYKTPTKAYIKVEPEGQIMPLGDADMRDTKLADIRGEMKVIGNDWDYFRFSGEITGFRGIEGDRRKSFVVLGSINATDEEIKVEDIKTPFGGVSFVYDIKNARFIGSFAIDMKYSDVGIKGAAEILFDREGWYFLLGAEVSIPVIGKFKAGTLIGDYNRLRSSARAILLQYTYKQKMPESFENKISGFLTTGQIPFPIKIPKIEIDVKFAQFKVGVEIGIDARLWMNFGKGESEFGLGAMVFAKAHAAAGADLLLASFCLSGAVLVELGIETIIGFSNPSFALDCCGAIGFGYCIGGCFMGSCDYASGSFKGQIGLKIDTDEGVDLYMTEGTCSGTQLFNEIKRQEDPCGCK